MPLIVLGLAAFFVSACDDSSDGGNLAGSSAPAPSEADLAQGNRIADAAAGQIAATSEFSQFALNDSIAATADSVETGADLSELGGDASANR